MLFEVKNGKQRLFWSEHKECIETSEIRNSIRDAGLKIYLDGKIWPKETEKAKKNNT